MRGEWHWLSDPDKDKPGHVARALAAKQPVRLGYGATVWILVHDVEPRQSDPESRPSTTYRLHLRASFLEPTWFGLWAYWSVRGRLKRAVEHLSVTVDEHDDAPTAVMELLSRAGAAIDEEID